MYLVKISDQRGSAHLSLWTKQKIDEFKLTQKKFEEKLEEVLILPGVIDVLQLSELEDKLGAELFDLVCNICVYLFNFDLILPVISMHHRRLRIFKTSLKAAMSRNLPSVH